MSNINQQFGLTAQQLAIKLAHLSFEELQDVLNQANRKLQQDGSNVVLGATKIKKGYQHREE